LSAQFKAIGITSVGKMFQVFACHAGQLAVYAVGPWV
jgi:hypothetical protein